MERKYYEAYDDRYRQVHRENLSWFSETPSHIVMDTISEYDINGKILELGCGEGRDALTLMRKGFDLLATDISPEAIAYCRKQEPEYAERFQVLNCVDGHLHDRFDYIYAVAVVHMLVDDADRRGFYCFLREHLTEKGLALICTMGDGTSEHSSDGSSAFEPQKRVHERTGKVLTIASTSYRSVYFESFAREITEQGLKIVKQGITDIEPDYWKTMYAVVKRDDPCQTGSVEDSYTER